MVRGPVSHLWQNLQKLSPQPVWCTQGKLASGYRGDQLTPPSLEMSYAWLQIQNSKCNSPTGGSVSLNPARPGASAQGPSSRLRTAGAELPWALGRAPHLLRPFGRSHLDSSALLCPTFLLSNLFSGLCSPPKGLCFLSRPNEALF